MFQKGLLVGSLAVLGLPALASAVVIASDNFTVGMAPADYTVGAIVPQTPTRTGFAGAWSNLSNLTGTTPNAVAVNAAGQEEVTTLGAVAYRALATPLTDVAGNTYYIRFDIANTSADNTAQRFFGLALFTGTSERMLIGSGSGLTTFSIGGVTAPAVSTTDNRTASTLLVKLVFNGPGTAETASFFVNPDFNQAENSPANTAAKVGDFTTTFDNVDINRIRIGGGIGNASQAFVPHVIDNFSIFQSTSPTDTPFVPEPASLTVLGIAAFVGLTRRRAR